LHDFGQLVTYGGKCRGGLEFFSRIYDVEYLHGEQLEIETKYIEQLAFGSHD
jgi:hypothetical protein